MATFWITKYFYVGLLLMVDLMVLVLMLVLMPLVIIIVVVLLVMVTIAAALCIESLPKGNPRLSPSGDRTTWCHF